MESSWVLLVRYFTLPLTHLLCQIRQHHSHHLAPINGRHVHLHDALHLRARKAYAV